MTSWAELAAVEPAFAAEVRRTFQVRRHATLATLRRDGAPRISGTEVEFDDGTGELPARFRVDLDAVVLTRVGRPADHLVIESWHPGRPLRRRTRT